MKNSTASRNSLLGQAIVVALLIVGILTGYLLLKAIHFDPAHWVVGQANSKMAKPYAVLNETFYPTSVVWSPDGQFIADTSFVGDSIHVWNVKERRIIRNIPLPGSNVGYHALAWSPDGNYLAVCANKDTMAVRIWDTHTWKAAADLPAQRAKGGGCVSLSFNTSGSYLAVGAIIDAYIYSTKDWGLQYSTNFGNLPVGFAFDIKQIAFQPHSDKIAMGVNGYFPGDPANGHSRIIFWNIHSPPPIFGKSHGNSVFIAYPLGEVESIAFSPTGAQLATGPASGSGSESTHNLVTYSARIWGSRAHNLLGAPLDGHDAAGEINGLIYTDDGRYLIAAHTSRNSEIDFIDATTFKLVGILHTHEVIGSLAMNPSAPMFVATDDRKLLIWSVR